MRKTANPRLCRRAALFSATMLLAVQALAQTPAKLAPPAKAPAPGEKAAATFYKFAEFLKHKGELTVAGMLKGTPVFKNTQGQFFTVDPATGNLAFQTPESLGFVKHHTGKTSSIFIKFEGIKGEQRVTLVGVDAQGRVVQKNARGESFYLNPQGDMVFVK